MFVLFGCRCLQEPFYSSQIKSWAESVSRNSAFPRERLAGRLFPGDACLCACGHQQSSAANGTLPVPAHDRHGWPQEFQARSDLLHVFPFWKPLCFLAIPFAQSWGDSWRSRRADMQVLAPPCISIPSCWSVGEDWKDHKWSGCSPSPAAPSPVGLYIQFCTRGSSRYFKELCISETLWQCLLPCGYTALVP